MSIRSRIDRWLRQFEKDFATQNRIEVSRSALVHNFDLFAGLTGKQIIPVLKANAYGHGLALVAEALKTRRFPYIAVDGYFEALRVREVSDQPVLIMGAIRAENFARLKYDKFAFVVQDAASIQALAKTGKYVKVHLECNTGMNRYGADPEDVAALTKLILRHKNLTLEGIMSHLADSDGKNEDTVRTAVALFGKCVETVRAAGADPALIHLGQSAGSLREDSRYANTIRLGIGLYGLNPFPATHPLYGQLNDLRPALRFVATITKITDLQKGDKVSYNYTYEAPKGMKIAVLPVGYYEGVSRDLSNVGAMQIGADYTPIVGRVCMNHTMISLDGFNAKVGDEVVVYSNNAHDRNSIGTLATTHNLFAYSLLTSLSSEVHRELVK
jgi:alanine racemase